jgi:hypothetical protein
MSGVIDRRNWNIHCAGNSDDPLQAFVGMDNCGVDLKKVRDLFGSDLPPIPWTPG